MYSNVTDASTEYFLPAELTTALLDIPELARQSPTASLGVIVLALEPDTAFYRLQPESPAACATSNAHRICSTSSRRANGCWFCPTCAAAPP